MRHVVASVAVMLVALLAPPADAFASKGDSSPHDRMTESAAEGLGWPDDAVEALRDAVSQPDADDLKTVEDEDGSDRLEADITYRPWHHCSRQPPGSDAEAFNATVAYVREQREWAENLSLLDPSAAMRALGRALHALQDCYSHSNIVDLDAVAQGELARALLEGGPGPSGLVLCGVLPHSGDLERPPGDAYSHAQFNKDDDGSSPEADAKLGDGRSKHDAAYDLAAAVTRDVLRDFMERLDADQTARLLAVDDDAGDQRDEDGAVPIPAAGLASLAAVAALAVLARRRA